MTTSDIPEDAVEAAARAYVESGLPNVPRRAGRHYHAMRAALTAAAPHIEAQATVDLRAGIEALRDEWRAKSASLRAVDSYAATLCDEHADALDALLRERA